MVTCNSRYFLELMGFHPPFSISFPWHRTSSALSDSQVFLATGQEKTYCNGSKTILLDYKHLVLFYRIPWKQPFGRCQRPLCLGISGCGVSEIRVVSIIDVLANLGLTQICQAQRNPKYATSWNIWIATFIHPNLRLHWLPTSCILKLLTKNDDIQLQRWPRPDHSVAIMVCSSVPARHDVGIEITSLWGVKMCEFELQTVHQTWRWDVV